MYGPETKRTLLPSQVTGIDTVKALFVRYVNYLFLYDTKERYY